MSTVTPTRTQAHEVDGKYLKRVGSEMPGVVGQYCLLFTVIVTKQYQSMARGGRVGGKGGKKWIFYIL